LFLSSLCFFIPLFVFLSLAFHTMYPSRSFYFASSREPPIEI
jgi:hypothetical protein